MNRSRPIRELARKELAQAQGGAKAHFRSGNVGRFNYALATSGGHFALGVSSSKNPNFSLFASL